MPSPIQIAVQNTNISDCKSHFVSVSPKIQNGHPDLLPDQVLVQNETVRRQILGVKSGKRMYMSEVGGNNRRSQHRKLQKVTTPKSVNNGGFSNFVDRRWFRAVRGEEV